MVAAAEKCSVSGLEPSIVWSVAEPDGAGPRSILLESILASPDAQARGNDLFEKFPPTHLVASPVCCLIPRPGQF